MHATTASFRFCDLPVEIRCKIYRILLCEFSPQAEPWDPYNRLGFQRVHHSIKTDILRTSTEVHHEAYDVMVKTNRFVKVTTDRGFPLRKLFTEGRLPVVAESRDAVERFSGYVLAVDLVSTKPLLLPPTRRKTMIWDSCTFMILHENLDKFCCAVVDGEAYSLGLSGDLKLTITVGPVLQCTLNSKYSFCFEEYFTEKTQLSLLAVFRKGIRGRIPVIINGHISKALSEIICNDMKQDEFSDLERLLEEFGIAKEDGSSLIRHQDNDAAWLRWHEATVDIERIHKSSSWSEWIDIGGDSFVSQLAELYFCMQLNIAHIKIVDMQKWEDRLYSESLAHHALNAATGSLQQNFWASGFEYRPSIKDMAKLQYRFANFLRLQNKPGTDESALEHINEALELQPDDAVAWQEWENIRGWKKDNQRFIGMFEDG